MLEMKRSPRLKSRAVTKLNTAGIISLIILLIIILIAIFAPVLTPYDPVSMDTIGSTSPSWQHPFGTDRFGRDVMTRVFYGSRVSLLIGMLSVGVAGIVGLIIGVAAGYFGGFFDAAVMRLMDSISVIPYLLFAVLAAVSHGFNSTGTTIAICISLVPNFATWSRALVLNIHGKGFLETERAFGIRKSVILFRHVLPNIISQYISNFTKAFSEAILAVTTLGYLGYAVQPPYPEWGDMLTEGYRSMLSGKWWLTVFPGLMILITVICVNLLGNNVSSIISSHSGTNGGRS